jgi:hypothetical protein
MTMFSLAGTQNFESGAINASWRMREAIQPLPDKIKDHETADVDKQRKDITNNLIQFRERNERQSM